MWRLVATPVLAMLLAACSSPGGADAAGTPTPSPTRPPAAAATPTPTSADPTLPPSATPTPTLPGASVGGSLLSLSPESGVTVASQAIFVRGTAASGSTVSINGVDTELDVTGEFSVPVIVGSGENVIVIEATGAEGERVRRELLVFGP